MYIVFPYIICYRHHLLFRFNPGYMFRNYINHSYYSSSYSTVLEWMLLDLVLFILHWNVWRIILYRSLHIKIQVELSQSNHICQGFPMNSSSTHTCKVGLQPMSGKRVLRHQGRHALFLNQSGKYKATLSVVFLKRYLFSKVSPIVTSSK